MNQLSFGDIPARRSDPETSKEAATALILSGSRQRHWYKTLRGVRDHPNCTFQEISERAGLDEHIVSRRLSEIERHGWIQRLKPRRCAVSGRRAATWIATELGAQALANTQREDQ